MIFEFQRILCLKQHVCRGTSHVSEKKTVLLPLPPSSVHCLQLCRLARTFLPIFVPPIQWFKLSRLVKQKKM
jgi:hypothetical protein